MSSLNYEINDLNSRESASDSSSTCHFEYDTVLGFFKQDDPEVDSSTFDAMQENFGLIEQGYETDELLPANGKDLTQWQRFEHRVRVLNQKAAKDVSYRVLYLGRHGNGYHNVGATFYGSEAWDCYYSTLRNDSNIPSVQFFDAHLTVLGRAQATLVSKFWQRMITEQHIPVPQTYYSSPLVRALQTANLTFQPLEALLPTSSPYQPQIKELLREGHGIHTCDSRSSKTEVQQQFPNFTFEPSFREHDELFSPSLREPPPALVNRLRRLLDDIFTHDSATYISMTSHSGTIGATLRALNHRKFQLPTGGVIPVLVCAKRIPGPRPDDGHGNENRQEWDRKPECVNDPRKAGMPGYADIREYIEEMERAFERAGEESLAGMVEEFMRKEKARWKQIRLAWA